MYDIPLPSSFSVQHAGIYPTSEQIKLFSDHLPSSSLSEILVGCKPIVVVVVVPYSL